MSISESISRCCSSDTVPSGRTDVDVHKVRERVRAYPTLITAGKGASHPQLPSNTPGYGRVNEMNGPNVAHSLPHVRWTTAKPETALLTIAVFRPLHDFSTAGVSVSIVASPKLVFSRVNTIISLHAI